MKRTKSPLQKAIEKLIASYSADEIFTTLTAYASSTPYENDGYLTDEIISYLNITKRMTVIKTETLKQEMELQEKLQSVFQSDNEKQGNLFLSF